MSDRGRGRQKIFCAYEAEAVIAIISGAVEKAKNQLAESMEDILDDFNDNLKNVKKIYGSISDAITSNQGGKETVVKIS